MRCTSACQSIVKEQWDGILTDMGRCKLYLKFHFYEIKYNFDGEFNS